MTTMFKNYDEDINKKEYPAPIEYGKPPRTLETGCKIEIARDVFDNEIGVRVLQGFPFTLYFEMDGFVEGTNFSEFIKNCSVSLNIIDHWDKIILEKEFVASDIYDEEINTLAINFTQEDVENFRVETYNISLSLIWSGGKYDLYTKNDGVLIVR